MHLTELLERIKNKIVGQNISAADYEDHEDLIRVVAKAALEASGRLGVDNFGNVYDAQRVKPRDDRGAHWSGGRKKR